MQSYKSECVCPCNWKRRLEKGITIDNNSKKKIDGRTYEY